MALFETHQIGWIGLGSMGLAMATNVQNALVKRGLSPLKFYNRTASKGQTLQERGAEQCTSISDLVQKSDCICISTSNDSALRDIINEILKAEGDLSQYTIIDTTTVHPDTTKEVAAMLSQRGATFVAAPVFGPPPSAVSGELFMAVAGSNRRTLEMLAQTFKGVIAQDVLVVSDLPEKALLLKTLGNFIVAGVMEIVSEANVLAEKSGLDLQLFESFLGKRFGDFVRSSSTRQTTGVYIPEKGQKALSDLTLAIKDVQHGIDCAQAEGTRLKVAEVTMEHLKRAKEYSVNNNERSLDSSSLYGVIRQDAGLDFRNNIVMSRPEEQNPGS